MPADKCPVAGTPVEYDATSESSCAEDVESAGDDDDEGMEQAEAEAEGEPPETAPTDDNVRAL